MGRKSQIIFRRRRTYYLAIVPRKALQQKEMNNMFITEPFALDL